MLELSLNIFYNAPFKPVITLESKRKMLYSKTKKAGGSIIRLPYRALLNGMGMRSAASAFPSLLIGKLHPLSGRSSARIWQSGAVAAREAHNLEVVGPSPASATSAEAPPFQRLFSDGREPELVPRADMLQKHMKEFYTSPQWKSKRAAILARDGYMCQRCKRYGRQREATTVHHIKHYDEYPELALESDNLISLCEACHNFFHPEKAKKSNKSRGNHRYF